MMSTDISHRSFRLVSHFSTWLKTALSQFNIARGKHMFLFPTKASRLLQSIYPFDLSSTLNCVA
jgi:hypothetical protein